MLDVEAPNIVHVKMRVVDASNTRQQISNGSDVVVLVMSHWPRD